jgi:hypothetical protein
MTTLPLLPLSIARVPSGLRQALGQEGVPFVEFARARSATRFVLFDSRTAPAPALAEGQRALDVDTIRRRAADNLISHDALAELTDERSAPRAWQVGPWQAVEEVARADKRALRRAIMPLLRQELERQGGVWATISAFPHPYRSAFNFRFDHDDFVLHDFDAVLTALRGWEGAASHYVCGSTHEGQTEVLARLRGMDIGSHGYWHHTYVHASDNARNIARGIEVLRAAGIEPAGFVAPHGRFNAGLLRTLQRLGITHSSEFGLAYDELPFFPGNSSVLQIPVHPVSLGAILEAARRQSPAGDEEHCYVDRAVAAAGEHFRVTARSKYAAGEPIFFYCHPNGRLGRYPQVLRAVLEEVAGYPALWKTSYTLFAAWWRQRADLAIEVEVADGGYSIAVDRLPAGFVPVVEWWQGNRVAALPLQAPRTHISPLALSYTERRAPVPSPAQAVPAPLGWRRALVRSLDWERVTPPNEIRVRSPHTFVKKTLRYLRR